MRALITGIGGFAGGHLAAALVERGDEVVGYTLPAAGYPQLAPIADRVTVVAGDVRDAEKLAATLAEQRPDVVFHLAAVTHVARARESLRHTLEVNVLGSAAVLAAIGELQPAPRLVLASSGQVYGAGRPTDPSFDEGSPPAPRGPYASSKLCAEVLALQAWRSESLECVVLRAFNFTGPWQTPDFVCSDFARQIAWAEAGRGPARMTVGNLEARRDFSDVVDIVDGYIRAALDGRPGSIYNLAGGEAVRVGDVLDRLLEMADVEVEIVRDPSRLRPSELSTLAGDASKARRELGWRPRVPLEKTLRSVLDFWRARATRRQEDGWP